MIMNRWVQEDSALQCVISARGDGFDIVDNEARQCAEIKLFYVGITLVSNGSGHRSHVFPTSPRSGRLERIPVLAKVQQLLIRFFFTETL